MAYFATLDDSCVQREGIFVYAHALVLEEQAPIVKVFYNNSAPTKEIEEQLRRLLLDYTAEVDAIYACGHYRQYPSVWAEFGLVHVNQRQIPRSVRKCFTIANDAAKHAAQTELEKILSQRNRN